MGQAGESIGNKFKGKRGRLTICTERQGITLDKFSTFCTLDNVGEGFKKVTVS